MRLNEVTYTDAKPVEGYGPGFFPHRRRSVPRRRPGQWRWHNGMGRVRGCGGVAGLGRTCGRVCSSAQGRMWRTFPLICGRNWRAAALGVEAMSSPAAARTYNVLLSEGRRIALAMLPV